MELPEIRVYSAGHSPVSVDVPPSSQRSSVSGSGGSKNKSFMSNYRKGSSGLQSPQLRNVVTDDSIKRAGKVRMSLSQLSTARIYMYLVYFMFDCLLKKLQYSTTQTTKLSVDGNLVESVNSFIYLGSFSPPTVTVVQTSTDPQLWLHCIISGTIDTCPFTPKCGSTRPSSDLAGYVLNDDDDGGHMMGILFWQPSD